MRPVRMLLTVAVALCALGALGAAPPSPPAPMVPVRLSFVSHAALFSLMTGQETLVDPEIFVAAPGASPALGFEQLAHLANIRSAEMSDDPTSPALDANGRRLGFDLQHWFAANGVVQLGVPDLGRVGAQTIVVRFANLVPRGRYSVFLGHLEARRPTYPPLDGSGKTNSFSAADDGTAGATVVAPQAVPRGSALFLVYHADRKGHGRFTGDIGIDAFRQLVVRVP